MTFHILGIIIPADELIFFRGVETTNQIYVHMCIYIYIYTYCTCLICEISMIYPIYLSIFEKSAGLWSEMWIGRDLSRILLVSCSCLKFKWRYPNPRL